MYTALTIAGSGSSGDVGIQADLKTMTAYGVYGMSAITALTAQNTTGVTGIMEVTPELLGEQLDDIFTDIFPDAVKIGMASSSRLIEAITDKLPVYHGINIVVNPIMVATSGSRFIDEAAVQVLKEWLIPMVDLLTPNVPEVEILSGIRINSQEDMEEAARIIGENCGCVMLCKGGHQHNDVDDLLYRNGELYWFMGERVQNPNTYGTGCTPSSVIASNPAKRTEMDMVMEKAKVYLSGALGAMLNLDRSSDPMNHASAIKGEYQGGREYE